VVPETSAGEKIDEVASEKYFAEGKIYLNPSVQNSRGKLALSIEQRKVPRLYR